MHLRRAFLWAFSLGLIASACAAPPLSPPPPAPPPTPHPPFGDETVAAFDDALAMWFAEPTDRALGAVAGVIGPDGLWVGAIGDRDLESPASPMEPRTVVSFGSITKWFTATLVLRLVEEGLIDLDEPALVDCPASEPDCPGARNQPTVRDLLVNRSGFYSVLGIDDVTSTPPVLALPDFAFIDALDRCTRGEIATVDPRVAMSSDEMLYVEVLGRDPVYMPQSASTGVAAWAYVNSNWILLQRLIEERTGVSYFEALDERVLAPLGLESFYHSNARDSSAVGVASVDGEPLHVDARGCMGGFGGYGVSGAGGIRGEVSEILLLARALYEGEILEPATLSTMMNAGGPEPRGLVVGPYRRKYGMGTFIEPSSEGDYGGALAYGHDGGQAGFAAVLRYMPDTGYGVVVVANTWGLEEKAHDLVLELHAIAVGSNP
jgi:D-alanyl-D-alanine carboxypeptidase